MKDIEYISFFRRSPQSVEDILSIRLNYTRGCFVKDNGVKYSKEASDNLLHQLFDVLKVEETEDAFKAFLYEGRKDNYQIKFFLEIAYKDGTYLAVKGTQPFQQKNYKEIQALFEPFLK